MKNYFIIHGTNSDQYANWFPWLYGKIIKKDEVCFVPQFPIGELQNYSAWKKILKSYADAGIVNSETIFVCHSLGCVFVTRFVIESKIKVAGIVAVAGFNSDGLVPEVNELNKTFLIRDKKLSGISKFVKFFHCIYSNDDPYLSVDSLAEFAKITNAKVHEIEKGKHLNGEAGFKEFPFLWELLDKINTIV